MTVLDAIRTYTWNRVYSGCGEDIKGSIENGKFADLVVLSDDILTILKEKIKDIKVDLTIVGGQIIHQILKENNKKT
ncbi:MAG: amidohydrolase family protein [Candidatus Hodarchaeota archaeon]